MAPSNCCVTALVKECTVENNNSAISSYLKVFKGFQLMNGDIFPIEASKECIRQCGDP